MASRGKPEIVLTNFIKFLAGTLLFELVAWKFRGELEIDTNEKTLFLGYLTKWLFGKNKERKFSVLALMLAKADKSRYWTKSKLEKWDMEIEGVANRSIFGILRGPMRKLFLHSHEIKTVNKRLNILQAFLSLPAVLIGKHTIPEKYQHLWLYALAVKKSGDMLSHAEKLAVSGILTGFIVLMYPLLEYPLAGLLKHLFSTRGFPIATEHQILVSYGLFFTFYLAVIMSEYLSLKENREVVFLGSSVLRYLAGFSAESSVLVARTFDLFVDNLLFQVIIVGVSTKFLIADLIAKLPLFTIEFLVNMWFRLRKTKIFRV
ncbi:MAG: hypothetical protein HYW23_01700 [Candidatus Aenigmarchaeota archaeon]|nr:hypothetical protein [Candidatus Aenigmarchaeota archaeon]